MKEDEVANHMAMSKYHVGTDGRTVYCDNQIIGVMLEKEDAGIVAGILNLDDPFGTKLEETLVGLIESAHDYIHGNIKQEQFQQVLDFAKKVLDGD